MVSGRMTDGDSLARRNAERCGSARKIAIAPLRSARLKILLLKKRSYLWIYHGFRLNQNPV